MVWEGEFADVPDYVAAYADGYIDAATDLGLLDLQDREASEVRNSARDACRGALAAMALKAIFPEEFPDDGDVTVEVRE